MKRIQIPVNGIRDYVELFNGLFQLTKSEVNILTEFIRCYLTLKKNSRDENAFSTEMKKKVAERLNRDDFNTLNTYIKRLKDKQAISKTKSGYKINPILIPTDDNKIQIELK